MVRHKWVTAGSIALGFLLGPVPASPQTKPMPKPSKQEEKIENTLAHAVRHQLKALPFYSVFDFLDFSLDGAKVTLSGQVERPTLKAEAEAAVKSLEGIGSVVNNIEVLPPSAADHEIARNIYRSIFEDAVLQKYAVEPVPPIHIIVKSGAVSLEGVVDSEADKALAGNLATKVPNVVGLRNNLVVHKKEIPAK